MKQILNAMGSPFAHVSSDNPRHTFNKFKWEYDTYNPSSIAIVWMDYAHRGGISYKGNKHKFLWLGESKEVTTTAHADLLYNTKDFIENYDAIFTHDRELVKLHPNIIYCHNISGIPWIENIKLNNKCKSISMILSNKKHTKGQILRHQVANQYKEKIDIYGYGINPIDKKEEGLNDYMFSIAIENGSYETYFTEKILDCFATGTIPIYWGSPDIGNYFNMDGIVLLDRKFDINILDEKYYNERIDAIKDNFERCNKLIASGEIIYNLIMEKINE